MRSFRAESTTNWPSIFTLLPEREDIDKKNIIFFRFTIKYYISHIKLSIDIPNCRVFLNKSNLILRDKLLTETLVIKNLVNLLVFLGRWTWIWGKVHISHEFKYLIYFSLFYNSPTKEFSGLLYELTLLWFSWKN